MVGTCKLVALGNADALERALKGDVEGALTDIENIRDKAIGIECDPSLQNEIECRHLEARTHIAGVAKDWAFFAQCLQDIGKSKRFSADRLHECFEVFGEELKQMMRKSEL